MTPACEALTAKLFIRSGGGNITDKAAWPENFSIIAHNPLPRFRLLLAHA